MATPLSSADEIHQRIAELQAALDTASPGISGHLLKIHRDLGQSPELLSVLSEAEISTIAKGLQQQSGVEILAEKPKTKKKENLRDLEI